MEDEYLVASSLLPLLEAEYRRVLTEKISTGEAALRYEAQLLGLSEEKVMEEMLYRIDVMAESVERGLGEDLPSMQLLNPTARKIHTAEAAGKLAAGGMHTRAATRAMAAMHVNCGMGVVCVARHVGLQRDVALKLLRAGVHASPQEIERFLVEAQATAGLSHPGVVQGPDRGQEAGRHYLGMDPGGGGRRENRRAAVPCDVSRVRQDGTLVRDVRYARTFAEGRRDTAAGLVHRERARERKTGGVSRRSDSHGEGTPAGARDRGASQRHGVCGR